MTLENVQVFRKMYKGEMVEENAVRETPLSFPNFSNWVGTLLPTKYKSYGKDGLVEVLAKLYGIEKISKTGGVRTFNFCMTHLNDLSAKIMENFSSDLWSLNSLIYSSTESVTDTDITWYTQDFLLYLEHFEMHGPNYFWVNQGETYNKEVDHNCIGAPNSSVHAHKILKDLKEGDVLIHYSKTAIRATSVVVEEFEIKERPYHENKGLDIVVGVDYSLIEPSIPHDRIRPILKANKEILPKYYSPFDKNLNISQKYCCAINKEIYDAIFNINETEDSIDTNMNEITQARNLILYGPPGTGKTYTTKELSVRIIDGKTPQSRDELNKRYKELIDQKHIFFTTFHQSFSYEDFIEGIKPIPEAGDIQYDIIDGVFKEICDEAQKRNTSNFGEAYTKLIEDIQNKNEDYLDLRTQTGKVYSLQVNRNGNLNLFTTQERNQQGVLTQQKLELFFNDLPSFSGWESYAQGIIDYLKENYQLHSKTISKSENYVLIIDEINRGNISAIFGELITLLEDDKRIGEVEEIRAILPYSKIPFGVPSNVHIIGTMNTADHSVEALDTALRRRFIFEEIMPDHKLLTKEVAGVKLSEVLETINERIEVLIDRDHTIGHSYFMRVDDETKLAEAFANKILPLLQEYFYGDYGKIGLVLGEGFVERLPNKGDSFAQFAYERRGEFGGDRFKLKVPSENTIIEAIKKLLNNTEQ
jgi:hypothetical protein